MDLNMRYATARDGVCVAYATAGQGLPVIRAPYAPFSHTQLEWRDSTFFGRLCRSRMIIPFDPRGTGLSDRNIEDFSLEARLLDIDAVADALDLPLFALHAVGASGPLAIAYAAAQPERVSHLILDDAFANGDAYLSRPQMRAILQLSLDWEAMTENIAFVSLGFGGEEAGRYAEFLRACVKPDAADRMWAAIAEVDVTDLLPRVQAPTLILQHQSSRIVSQDETRTLATRIPNARLVPLQGKMGDVDTLLSAIGEFLGDELPTPPAEARPAAFCTVLFTDIEAHSEMFQRLGDEFGRAVLRDHERITRDALRAHGGTEIKSMGDGFMAAFDSATRAVQCAIDLQTAFASRNESAAEPIRVRVGLNAGEPIAEDDDLFGATVTIASRIMSCGSGGDILVSDVVRGLVAGKGFMFSDRGDVVLKGFEDPVRVYLVRWNTRN